MNLKICIDIGTKYIKIIEGYERRERLYITNIEKIDNPVENFGKIKEDDEEILGNFLKDFLKKNKFKGQIGIAGISSPDLIYHYFELPNLQKEELESAIKLEGVQIIPDFLENYEYDYISFNGNNKKIITLIACPKNKVDFYTQILLKSKLKPLIIDVNGIAVLNSFLYFNREEEPICILNIGFSLSNLVIYLKDKFLFLRDIQWGVKNVEKKEEEVYNDFSFYTNKIGEFSEEIKISLKYFQNKTGETINKIYLTGGGTKIPEMKENIEKNLNIISEYYNPLLNLSENLIPVDKKEDGMSYTVCTGLLTRKII